MEKKVGSLMIKQRLDYKLINILLIVLMIYLVYQTHDFWLGLFDVIIDILFPFIVAFAISYALYPILKNLMDHNIPKGFAVFIIIFLILAIIIFLLILIIPTIFSQIGDILGSIISFFKKLSLDYNINLYGGEETLNKTFNDILAKISENISDGAMNAISISIGYITKLFIILAASIYFLIDMDKIRLEIKMLLKRKSKKLYRYVIILDDEMTKYLGGFLKIAIISFFEYLIIYFIIGHPNYLMLGALASIGNLVPYFGGIFTNIIAAVTALAVSDELFIKTLIVLIVFSMIDGYIINPHVFGKTNKLHPLAVIIAVFAGGILFVTIGIIISLPVAIMLIATYKYFKADINKIGRKKSKIRKKYVK